MGQWRRLPGVNWGSLYGWSKGVRDIEDATLPLDIWHKVNCYILTLLHYF